MNLVIKGKNLDVTPALRDYITSKLGKIPRYSSHVLEAEIELSINKNPSVANNQTVEVTISANGAMIRSEESAGDMYTAIDLVKDKIERRLRKYEERRSSKPHRAGRVKTSIALAQAAEREEEARGIGGEEMESPEEGELVSLPITSIQRRKRFKILAMSPEEAVHHMELLGHAFFLFRNSINNNQLSVVYNRQGGTHGLIEPEI